MAIIGPIFDHRKCLPLSGVRAFYRGAPTDLPFGEGVTEDSLNDKALAGNLDSLHETGLEELFRGCYRLIKSRYGFDSRIRHMDCTDYTVHAVPPDNSGDGTAVPVYGGNAKDGRNDLLQYCTAMVTDGDRVLEYCRAYSDNASDLTMNEDTLAFLGDHLDPRDDTVIADSKPVDENLIRTVNGMGVDSVYVRTPERAGALLFAITIATLVSGIIDALLGAAGRVRSLR